MISIQHLSVLVFILHTTENSNVIDPIDQYDPYLSEYCSASEYCQEGTHVVCLYYDSKRPLGPQCSNAIPVSVTPNMKRNILEQVNTIRARLATGNEIGKNDKPLPRAYGMNRVAWDSQLAYFAQIWANQCTTTKDLCRYTKNFPNPSQNIAEVRFTFPDWQRRGNVPSAPGVTEDNLNYAFTSAIKSWYAFKYDVDDEMIRSLPEFREQATIQNYLSMIHGPTTHIGCGITPFTKYVHHFSANGIYNSMLVVCNFATQPNLGEPMYSLDNLPPSHGPCGCPEDTQEDYDCLCYKKPNVAEIVLNEGSCGNKECDSDVIMVPIVQVNDEPSDQLMQRVRQIERPLASYIINKLANSSLISKPRSMEVYLDDANQLHEIHNEEDVQLMRPMKDLEPFVDLTRRDGPRRYYGLSASREEEETRLLYQAPNPSLRQLQKISDSLTNEEKNKLINKRNLNYDMDNKWIHDAEKTEVSSIEEIIKMYLKYRRQDKDHTNNNSDTQEYNNNAARVDDVMQKEVTSTAKTKNLDIDDHMKIKREYVYQAKKPRSNLKNTGNDSKLIQILDSLEKEIKQIDLNDKEKDRFDAKIKKIYRSLVKQRTKKVHNSSKVNNTIDSDSFQSESNEMIHAFNTKPIYHTHHIISGLKKLKDNSEKEIIDRKRFGRVYTNNLGRHQSSAQDNNHNHRNVNQYLDQNNYNDKFYSNHPRELDKDFVTYKNTSAIENQNYRAKQKLRFISSKDHRYNVEIDRLTNNRYKDMRGYDNANHYDNNIEVLRAKEIGEDPRKYEGKSNEVQSKSYRSHNIKNDNNIHVDNYVSPAVWVRSDIQNSNTKNKHNKQTT